MNIKTLFEKNLKGILKVSKFKVFYAIFAVTIIVVATIAVVVSTYNIYSLKEYDAQKVVPEETTEYSLSDTSNQEHASTNTSSINNKNRINEKSELKKNDVPSDESQRKQTNVPKDNQENTKPNNIKQLQPKKESHSEEILKFVFPTSGEITTDFSNNTLIYSKTLNEWRAHNGIDIKSERGTPVKAAASGFVSEVKDDIRYGVTVIIEHPGEVKTSYSNLASDNMVVQNQKINQGEVIGCVGNTSKFEALEEAHIHFEVIKNGEFVDPKQYLPKIPNIKKPK